MGTHNKAMVGYKQESTTQRDKLIMEHLALVKYVVNKLTVYLPSFCG